MGFLLGVGRGLRGLFTKPLSGVAVFTVKATEGVASDVMRVTHAQTVDEHVRMRQPRLMIGSTQHARLLPYPRIPPVTVEQHEEAQNVLADESASPNASPTATKHV